MNNSKTDHLNNNTEPKLPTELSFIYEKFEKYLHPHASLLDIESGFGRDSQYFLNSGYHVTSFDSNADHVDYSQAFLPEIQLESLKSFKTFETYDGIWASSSLIHLNRNDIRPMIQKYIDLMRHDGIFYMSFKCSDYDYIKEGRQFTCFTKETLETFMNKFKGIKIVELFETEDLRAHRSGKWVNVIIMKV
ncbi:MAG: class I SAM-dependent methyltransferase [Erysipelothrix sp.]|jgi:SAM-dependent methyltransferase|nr:class I SAM-dependent methyltransferase [Erysipelothrix sp.]